MLFKIYLNFLEAKLSWQHWLLFSILSRYFVLIYIDQGGNFGSERWREGGEGTKEEGATKGEKGEEGEKEGKVKKESY